MKDVKAFLKIRRRDTKYRPVSERLTDHKDAVIMPTEEESHDQALRCMDCGTPFCHWACPLGNYIPEFNDASVIEGRMAGNNVGKQKRQREAGQIRIDQLMGIDYQKII